MGRKIFFWGCLWVFLFGIFMGNSGEAAPFREAKPIVVKTEAGYAPISDVAYVNANEILVSFETLKNYVDGDAVYRSEENRVFLTVPSGRLTTDNQAIKKSLQEKMVMSFPAVKLGGRPYVDVVNLDMITGLASSFDYSGHVILEPNSKTIAPYSVQALPAKGIPAGKINLAWDVRATSNDLAKEETVAGLNVLSPTWFSIVSGSGAIMSKADSQYVDLAHSKGYKVWALITNSFDPDLTHELLASETAQNRVIASLLFYSSYYGLDGINFDIENVYDQDKEALSAFIEKASEILKRQNLVVSVDVTVPSNVPNWSNCYDRSRLGKAVDYVMVMTYDEHWSKSPISGSVASLAWVKAGIDKTLRFVPKEKVLIGLPFYMREWEERETEEGTVKVRARTLSMPDAEEKIKNNHLTVNWLEKEGQYYTEYEREGKRYRIWLEEERSIGLKAALVDEYKLAGVASWRKGFEKKSIWQVLQTKLGQ